MPKLLLKYHAAVLKEIPITKTPITIGRKPDNDIAIDNMAVSSHHARITLQGKIYMIEDLQSTNGTFLNEKRIISAALGHNDSILLGQHSLQFVYPESLQSLPQADTQETILLNPDIQKKMLAELSASVAAAIEKPVAAPQPPPCTAGACAGTCARTIETRNDR
jgi:pSer/pThr/pTyr-binding forkhead associated (FHA) protein